MARNYKRDARGRFASGGGSSGGGGKKAAGKPKVTGKGAGMGGTKKGPNLNRDIGQTSNPRGTVAAGSFNNRSKVNNRIKSTSPANASGRERRQEARILGQGAGTTVRPAAPRAGKEVAPKARANAKPSAKKMPKATKANVTKKTKKVFGEINAKREAIRQADPGSKGLKNQAMSKKAEAAFAKTKEGKREKALGRMMFNREQNREATMSSGSGNKAKRRAKAMGLKITKSRPSSNKRGK
jgi:hypothetical protein